MYAKDMLALLCMGSSQHALASNVETVFPVKRMFSMETVLMCPDKWGPTFTIVLLMLSRS